jgi:enamine deaminase RidA (YjgF/YER057c/UK114 family)
MSHTIVNPPQLHDSTQFGYSHTASVSAGTGLVFVAGQYGSGPDGMVTAPDFADQLTQTFANIGTALAAHGLDLSHVVQLRTYMVGVDFERLGMLGGAVGQIWGPTPPTNTVLGVGALAMPDMLVEIEVVAAHP